MILESVFNLIFGLLEIVFGWINLPAFPQQLVDTLTAFEDLIFSNISCLSFFVRISTVKILLPLLLIVVNFDKAYKLTMFILRKIPFLGIE